MGQRLDLVGGEHFNSVSTAASTSGKKGNAAQGDGSSTYLKTTNKISLDPSTNFAISLWARPDADTFASFGVLLEQRSTGAINGAIPEINVFDNEAMTLVIKNDAGTNFQLVTSAGSNVLNQFNHIVYLKDGTTVEAYVNGVLEDSLTVTGTFTNVGHPFTVLVRDFSSPENYAEYSVDELYVWDGITWGGNKSSFVSALYNNGNGRFY